MGNNRHVSDVCRLVHEGTDLLDREAIEGHVLARASSLNSHTRVFATMEAVYES